MEAPLVCLDEEFEDLRPCRMDEQDHSSYSSITTTTTVPLASITREDFSELENFSEMMSFKSMEDLVNEFDEKLNVCFHNYNTKTEGLAPIRNQTHSQEDEERLQDEEWVTAMKPLADGALSGISPGLLVLVCYCIIRDYQCSHSNYRKSYQMFRVQLPVQTT